MKKQLICCSIAAALFAPASYSAMLEEVVVTAQKREQNLQDVGIAVSAFTGDQMAAMGVTQSVDIAAFTPGVHISGNLAGQNTQFSIRGVTQNDFNDVIEAPNAVYLDEGYLAIAQAQTFAVFDIERVEILKGPQGTLFGRNATGGLVHYVSNKPTFETEGYIDIGFGRYDTKANANEYTVEAALGGALSETVAGRVAVRHNQRDGYLKNLYPESAFLPAPGADAGADLGDDDTQAARLSLLFTPSDKLNISFSANYASSEVATGPYQSKSTIGIVNENGELINVIDTPADETRLTIQGDADGGADAIDGDEFLDGAGIGLSGRSVAGGDFFGYLDPDGDEMTFSSDFAFDDQGSTDTTGLNLKFDYELSNGMEFVSITDYKDYEKLLFIDVDAAPANQLANYAGVDATSLSQEFRLSGESEDSRWVTGFFYLNIDNVSDNGLKASNNSIAGSDPFAPVDIGVVAELETNSYSLFGQYEHDFSDKITVTAGLRVIREEKDFNIGIGIFPSFGNYSVNQGDFIPNAFGAGSPYLHAEDTSDTLWTGKAQIDYRPNEDLLIYAGINRGVKAGSFNAPLLGAYLGGGGTPSILPYDEEILLSYEAGFKRSFGDGSTRLNGSLFYYDYSDYQAFLFVGVGGLVVNADAENYGFELELQTSPMQGLDAMLSLSWFDATVEDVLLRSGSPLPPRDVDPTYAPELQVTGLVRYEWPAMGGMMSIQGDVSYSDEFYYNLRNFDADKFDSYVISNAQLGWVDSTANWQVSFAVRNITDERAGVQGFDLATLCGCNEVAYRDPRSFSLSIKREF
ncbi:TonB-dependent receptor [Porticoccaceae bacterium]|nr:TonB-dependent receptor [Porticoccaceae bacterium]